MIKVVAFVKKRSDLSREEFVRRWVEEHPKISRALGASPYRINIAHSPQEDATVPPYDGTAEMYWPDRATFRAALASPEGRRAAEDVRNFAASVELAVVDEWVVQ